MSEITRLLRDVEQGDTHARSALFERVHEAVTLLAQGHMRRESPGHSWQTTDLVGECYLKLLNAGKTDFKNRGHFYAWISETMRNLLVDRARRNNAQKRGSGVKPTPLGDLDLPGPALELDLEVLDDLLTRVRAVDSLWCAVAEMRLFWGHSTEDAARILEISPDVARRAWTAARAWFAEELS